MARYLDDDLIARAREARDKLAAGSARAAEAIDEVEGLLRQLGLGVRQWLPVGTRTIRSREGTRRIELFLGYSDEGDGAWGIKLKARDPRRPGPGRFMRLGGCAPSIQIQLVPKLRALVAGVVGRARELADLIERAIPETESPAAARHRGE